MLKDRTAARGAIHPLAIDSRALVDNLLGDPTNRAVPVYVPAGHDGRGLPLLVDIVGFTGGGPSRTNWKNFDDLVFGARRLHRKLDRRGIPHRSEEFPDNHSSIDYRMDESLPFLARALIA